MVEPIDEYALQSYPEHNGHRFVCIAKEGVELPPVEGGDEKPQRIGEEKRRLDLL